MNRTTKFLLITLSAFSATGASAAIFDSLESVDTLKVIAEQRAQKTDRMPAGKVDEAPKDEDAENVKVPVEKKEH